MKTTHSLHALAGLERIGSGKVRELYAADDELLLVATDRISAYDVVLPTEIPDKGKVLTGLTVFWLDRLSGIVDNHLITADVGRFPSELREHASALHGRSMLCRRAEMIPVECVARGYLAGSGWKEYRTNGTVCDIPLPAGLTESARLPEPIFTPATKATSGHDENISFEQMARMVGDDLAVQLRDVTLRLYAAAHDHARERGILLADTKFEFGFVGDRLILCDEVLTPDSSRFWPADEYRPGRGQASYDKQIVRDWLETQPWDKTPPGPELPDEVVARTRERYLAVYELLSEQPFATWAER